MDQENLHKTRILCLVQFFGLVEEEEDIEGNSPSNVQQPKHGKMLQRPNDLCSHQTKK